MSDYQVTNYGCCGECKWRRYDEFGRAWVCTNDSSDYVADFTDYTDGCNCFEQREHDILYEPTYNEDDGSM